MSLSFVIEVGGRAVGLIHRYDRHEPFRFIASDHRFHGLEGQSFSKPARAEAAARAWLAGQRKPRASKSGIVPFVERSLSSPHLEQGLLWA